MSHDHITLDTSPGKAPITICGHSTNDESTYKTDVGIEKHMSINMAYCIGSTTVDADFFPFSAGYHVAGVAYLRAKHLGPAVSHIAKPSGTDSKGQVAIFGLVTMLCSGTIAGGDWLVGAGTVGYGYMRSANAWDLSNSQGGRSAIAYGDSDGGLKEVLCVQLPWKINYNA